MTVQTTEQSRDESAPSTRLAVLLFTDIVDSTGLKARVGNEVYARLHARHNDLFESGLRECPGARIIGTRGDGYFAEFDTPSDAVRFALRFQARMGLEPWRPEPLRTRVGIHVGEVVAIEMGGKPDVSGLPADLAARLMSLATGGQILLTSQAFNDARQFVNRSPEIFQDTPPLKWLAHGPYLFKGSDEPLEVFEVGIENFSPLMRPPDSEKAKRVVPHDQEPMFGPDNPRPAVGIEVPKRPNWKLVRKLGEGGFGEVWLAEHQKLDERRVFKFCFNVDRLRSLKREYTLFRLLREALGDRPDIAKLYDYNLEEPPFFLESEYTEGGNLLEWAERKGGIDKIPLNERLELVAKVADAVTAAHSVGVLHKDIKPSNILVHENAAGTIQPRLSDFGIGILADRAQMQARAITETGFTQITLENESSRTGTRMYAPPESLLNKPFTTQGDVYALGVLLYQMVISDLTRPIASGWERDLADELLREDIATMIEGDPLRRLPLAREVAQRIRSADSRRAQRERARRAAAVVARRKRAFRVAAAGVVVMAVTIGAGIIHIRRLQDAKAAAEIQKRRAELAATQSVAALDFVYAMIRHTSESGSFAELLVGIAPRIRASFNGDPLVQSALLIASGNVLLSTEGVPGLSDSDLFSVANGGGVQRIFEQDLRRANCAVRLGGILTRQQRFADAEQWLIKASETLSALGTQAEGSTASLKVTTELRQCLELLYKLYQSWDKADRATECRRQLKALEATTRSLNNRMIATPPSAGAAALFHEALDLERAFLASSTAKLKAQTEPLNQASEQVSDLYRLKAQIMLLEMDLNWNLTSFGALLQARGALPQAEACYREALTLTPGSEAARRRTMAYLGSCLSAQEKFEQGEQCYREALMGLRDSEKADDLIVKTTIAFGILLEQAGDLDEASAQFRQILALKREFPMKPLRWGRTGGPPFTPTINSKDPMDK